MDGSHIAGGGLGALLGIILSALGGRVGLKLDDTTAATIAAGCITLGLAIGHALGKAWQGAGVFPSLRRGLFGAKGVPAVPAARRDFAVAVPPVVPPPPSSPQAS